MEDKKAKVSLTVAPGSTISGGAPPWLSPLLVLLALLLQGCALAMLGGSLTHPERLTAEQIQAYTDLDYDVYSCLALAGPPPVGGGAILTFPKDRKPDLAFGPNCVPMRADTGRSTMGVTEKPDKPPETMAPQPKPTIP